MEPVHATCNRCGGPNGRRHRWCAACLREYHRNRGSYARLTPEARKRAKARAYARVYRSRGLLVPEPCLRCGGPGEYMHHLDYDRPLKVVWFCAACHRGRVDTP